MVPGQWKKIVVKFMIPRHTVEPSKKYVSNCIHLRLRNAAYLILKLFRGLSLQLRQATSTLHSTWSWVFHDTGDLCCIPVTSVSEDTKHSGIVLEDCGVSRMCTFFSSTSRVVCHQRPAPACLLGFKSQSKSELTFMQYIQTGTGTLEWTGKLKMCMVRLTVGFYQNGSSYQAGIILMS